MDVKYILSTYEHIGSSVPAAAATADDKWEQQARSVMKITLPSDGHCFFHVLTLLPSFGEDQASARRVAVKYLQSGRSEFEEFINDRE